MSKTRTNIVLDDDLLAAAMKYFGVSTKREAVERALLRVARYQRLQDLRFQITDDSFVPGYLEDLEQPRWTTSPVRDVD